MIMDIQGDALLLVEHFIHFASLQPERLADAMWYDSNLFVCHLRCLDETFRMAVAEPIQKKKRKSDKRQPPLPDNFDSCFSEQVAERIIEFLAYKTERKDYYSPTGLRNLLTQIENRLKEHSEETITELISDCMANNWKGIIWDRIDRQDVRSYGGRYGRSRKRGSSEKDPDPWAEIQLREF